MALERKKKGKRIIGIALALLVAGGAGMLYYTNANKGPVYPSVSTFTLEKTDLQNLVNVTGIVESVDTKKIYSRLSYPVESLNVKVGDRVEVGDVLCQLETQSIEADITKQTASINKSQQNANITLANAQTEYANAKALLESDLNTQLMNAQTTLRNAEARLKQSGIELVDSRRDARESRERLDSDDIVEDYKSASRSAQITYDNDKAAVEDAKANLKAVEESIKQQMDKFQNDIKSAQTSTNFYDQWLGVEQLKSDLEKCTITAPVSGVVTGVYVSEGATPNGLMFVIEDTENLKITTHIKEYDIASIKIGNPVEIKSDATGEQIYDGQLEIIAPTSVKTASGDIDSSSDAEFEAEVNVLSKSTGLKIGMKTRMNIVVEEKSQVFAVPYEAIVVDANGQDTVYVARPSDIEGVYNIESVPVTAGMENDFYVEVESEGLAEGDQIISVVDHVMPGMQVTIIGDEAMAMGGGEAPAGTAPVIMVG